MQAQIDIETKQREVRAYKRVLKQQQEESSSSSNEEYSDSEEDKRKDGDQPKKET